MKLRRLQPDRKPQPRSFEIAVEQKNEQAPFYVFEEFPELDSDSLTHAINSGAFFQEHPVFNLLTL